jgi:hypothetical protein
MTDEWKTVADAWEYEINREGKVRNKKTGRILKPFKNGTVEQVTFSDHGYRLTRSVQTLIHQAFET